MKITYHKKLSNAYNISVTLRIKLISGQLFTFRINRKQPYIKQKPLKTLVITYLCKKKKSFLKLCIVSLNSTAKQSTQYNIKQNEKRNQNSPKYSLA